MRLRNPKWNLLPEIIFMSSIALALLGRAFCTRSWKDYEMIRSECTLPDVIETVLWNEDSDRLYVCYNDANRVNVYDGAGTFLWSVGTPYMRNSEFELIDGELVIFYSDAYCYDAIDGSFLRLSKEEDLPVRHTTWSSQETRRVGPYSFDKFQVYRLLPDGGKEIVIARPWWHNLFLFPLWWAVAALAVLCRGVFFLLAKLRNHRTASAKRIEAGTTLVFQSKEAHFLRNYYRVQSLIQTVAAAGLAIAICINTVFTFGLFPLVIHFIVSGWILENKRNRLVCSSNERSEVDFWHTLVIATIIADFLAVIVFV